MLIEFSVSNYRSFREKQTFSMVAAPRIAKRRNVFKPPLNKGDKVPDLLKVAAIYGPNASGKTNLITALGLVSSLVSEQEPLDALPVSPFRFDKSLTDEPSRFEVHFIAENLRYEFHLGLTAKRIVEEVLVAYPGGKETPIYSRKYTEIGEQYVFGDLEGGSLVHEAWRNMTGPRTLFLVQAAKNSNESLQQLRIPFDWFDDNLKTVPRDMEGLTRTAVFLGKRSRVFNIPEYMAAFLREIDVPVSRVNIDMRDGKARIDDATALREVDQDVLESEIENIRTTLTHTSALGDAQFDLSEESAGTTNLIGFTLPWMLLNEKKSGLRVIVVDELDSSLHPKIVSRLIEKLLTIELPVQLIFTTHDTHLMDTKLLRRDQFWLTERDKNGATQLHSIHEFEGRESEDLEKRYYEGRYRGLPILRKS